MSTLAQTSGTVSHFHERKEKDCLNCGATVTGRYCQACGQENLEPKESLGHLIAHVFEDITHFDGKFFTTMKPLLFKPGFLSEEYTKGRRASYLHPVRMYLFISAVFFLVAFSLPSSSKSDEAGSTKVRNYNIHNGKATVDTVIRDVNGLGSVNFSDSLDKANGTLGGWSDSTVAAYTARQAALPKGKRDGWLKHYFNKRMVAAREYSHKHPDNFKERLKENFQHAISRVFFISLPLFAFVLYLLYWRRRKTYYYVSHVIFSLHFYCATFLILIVAMFFVALMHFSTAFGIVAFLIFLLVFIYQYIAIRRFYKQGIFKTVLKFIFINVSFAIFMLILTIIFSINSLLSVV